MILAGVAESGPSAPGRRTSPEAARKMPAQWIVRAAIQAPGSTARGCTATRSPATTPVARDPVTFAATREQSTVKATAETRPWSLIPRALSPKTALSKA